MFHYTCSMDNLLSILRVGLLPNYCREEFTGTNQTRVWGIPMVSFCDIPLLKTASFRERYGHYAIGLEKDWALRHDVNPVLYVVNPEVYYSLSFYLGMAAGMKQRAQDAGCRLNGNSVTFRIPAQSGPIPGLAEGLNAIQAEDRNDALCGYVKPYSGVYQGRTVENYPENEWRYLVKDSAQTPWLRTMDEYKAWRGNNPEKPKPADALADKSLGFALGNIAHLVVETEREVDTLVRRIQTLDTLCGVPLQNGDRVALIQKIQSFQRISQDYL